MTPRTTDTTTATARIKTLVININTLSHHDRLLLMRGQLAGHVYIGRAKDRELGRWGNLYTHLATAMDGTVRVRSRQEAIDMYACEKWSEGGFMERARDELKGKVLVCYCKPAACHGDLLAKWADT